MLWFIVRDWKPADLDGLFKYILCYGSSDITAGCRLLFLEFKYILCYGSS